MTLALLMVSLQDAWTGTFDWARLTVKNYYEVLFVDATAKRGLINSMIISGVGAICGRLDAGAMVEYFQPLQVWLDRQNAGRKLGW